jgi:hypothetical protein
MRASVVFGYAGLAVAAVAGAEGPADVPHVRSLQGVEDAQSTARIHTQVAGTVTAVDAGVVEIRAAGARLRLRLDPDAPRLRPGDHVTVDVTLIATAPPPGEPGGGPALPPVDDRARQVHRPDGDEDAVHPDAVGRLHPGR